MRHAWHGARGGIEAGIGTECELVLCTGGMAAGGVKNVREEAAAANGTGKSNNNTIKTIKTCKNKLNKRMD